MKQVLIGAALVFGLSLTIPAQVQETRFDIKTPPTTDAATLGISPDGDKIFFVADREGKYELWVHSLSAGTARPLEGAGDLQASAPCWSPDSRSIAFFSFQKLQRVDLDTGALRTLVSFRGLGSGCTWNRDGTILYSTSSGRSILRIGDEGGTPERVTPPDPSYYNTPYFLPDGQHFLFAANAAVYVGDLSGDAPKKINVVGTSPMYSPSGHLLFFRQGTLYAREFDPRTQSLLSGPFPVIEHVPVSIPSSAGASVSAAGHLVYRTGPGGSVRQFKWFDRTGKELESVGEPFGIGKGGSPELSPDGQTLALASETGDISLMDVSTGWLTSFISAPGNDGWPVWSPDGTTIYFSSNRTGQYTMYEKSVLGKLPERPVVVDGPAARVTRQVSPDGRYLLIREGGDISAVQLDRNPRSVVPVVQSPTANANNPQFAPDGRWIAYQQIDEDNRAEIYLRQFPSGRSIPVWSGVQPRWRPDGKELFFISTTGDLMAVTVELFPNGQEARVGAPKELFKLPIASDLTNELQQYLVSEDGKRFLVAAVPNLDFPIHVVRNWKPQK
jgi:Tol biopolymer transport system component